MANLDRPFGLKPVGHLNGSPWNGKTRVYYKAAGLAEAIFIGSLVKSAGSADTSGKYPTIQLAGTAVPRGVVVAFGNTPNIAADVTNLSRLYSPTLTANYVAVVDDPQVIFECQEDSSTTFTATAVGLNVSFTTETGNTTTGHSTIELDCSTENVTSTLVAKILRLVDRVDNALGTYSKWEILINVHAYGQGLGASGV